MKMSIYSETKKCRLCGNYDLSLVMQLGELALTGIFPKNRTEIVPGGPVDLVKCNQKSGCGLVQLKQSYSLDSMYGMNYGYRSGLNPSMVKHLENKVRQILSMGVLDRGDLVLDIGSNDSTTLRAYPEKVYDLVGIDPTAVKFSSFYPPSIRLIPEFFSANRISKVLDGRKAKVITSFSMFYDLEAPLSFAKEIEDTLHDDGVWILEQSYLPAMLQTNSFDTICHEHLEFYSLRQIHWICEKVGLKIIDVEFNEINGGSFSITTAKARSKHTADYQHIEQILSREEGLGLSGTDVFEHFRNRVEQVRQNVVDFLIKAKAEGKSVHALGASTKGNVLLQYFKLDSTLIKSIGEVNPDKYGSFTPGSLIPIVSEEEVLKNNPDYILVLPWHFKKFFIESDKFKASKLVFLLPNLEIATN
jgi:NDP-4-keto-2,6-dideoxyhexose 3-C-methyltransferase